MISSAGVALNILFIFVVLGGGGTVFACLGFESPYGTLCTSEIAFVDATKFWHRSFAGLC